MDPDTALAMLLSFFPSRWKPLILLGVMAIVILCSVVTALVKPPAPGTKLAGLYAVIAKIGLNVGWAVNAYQSGRKAIMVDKDADRSIIKAKLDIPADVNTKP